MVNLYIFIYIYILFRKSIYCHLQPVIAKCAFIFEVYSTPNKSVSSWHKMCILYFTESLEISNTESPQKNVLF